MDCWSESEDFCGLKQQGNDPGEEWAKGVLVAKVQIFFGGTVGQWNVA